MQHILIATTDNSSFLEASHQIQNRALLFNKDTYTLYEKINNEIIPIGSFESYQKGIKALFLEEVVADITEWPDYGNGATIFLSEDCVIDGVSYSANTFVINVGNEVDPDWIPLVSNSEDVDLDWIKCKGLTVQPDAVAPAFVANKYLGTRASNKNTILIQEILPVELSFITGHFIVYVAGEVLTCDINLQYNNMMVRNFVLEKSQDVPFDVVTCKVNGKSYFALNFANALYDFNVYFTGWTLPTFVVPDYSDSDVTDITIVSIGQVDSGSFKQVHFGYSSGSVNVASNIQSTYDAYEDWDLAPLMLKVVLADEADTNGYSVNLNNSNTTSATSAQKLSILTTILSDKDKPVYLDLSECTNLNGAFSAQSAWNFSGLEGLVGYVMPTDLESNCVQSRRNVVTNIPNLEYVTLNPLITELCHDGAIHSLPKLQSLDFPAGIHNWQDESNLVNVPNLKYIKYLNTTEVVQTNFWWGSLNTLVRSNPYFYILVPNELYLSYRTYYADFEAALRYY